MNKTINILQMALEANPEHWETRRHLAELLIDEGDHRRAQEVLANAVNVPENEEDELFLAEQLLETQPSQAAAYVDRTLRRNRGSAHAHWLKAQVFQALGLTDDARKHYTTAVVLDDAYSSGEFEALLDGQTSIPSISPDQLQSEAVEPTVESPAFAEDVAAGEVAPAREPEPASPAESSYHSESAQEPAVPVSVSGETISSGPVTEPAVAGTESPMEEEVARPGAPAVPAASAWSPKNLSRRIKATEAQAKKKNRAVAVFGAGLLHALLILLCLFWILKPGPLPEPTVIMSMKAPEDSTQQVEKKAIAQYLPQRPSSSSASRANVIAANTASPLAVPVVEIEEISDDILGAGDSFGMGSGWGDGMGGGGGGSVRFFGDEKQAKRVCYIVDFSYSMVSQNVEGDTRRDVLKTELIESIEKLEPSMRYTIIFFSGMPWLQGENPNSPAVIGRQRMQDLTLDVIWYDASKKNKQATKDAINGMAVANQMTGGGTIWMSGFRPAMNISPKPDLVYLLTDGLCQDYIKMPDASYEEFLKEFTSNTKGWEEFLGQMVELVPPGVSVNTIAMEIAGTVAARLAELAAKTGGDFSIVYEGKTYTGKRALRFGDKDYDEL